MAGTQTGFFALLLIASVLLVASTGSEPLERSEKVLKEKPIIIQNRLQHYDKPTLDEYAKCHENLDDCLKVCDGTADKAACAAECPTCPLLTDHAVVVQGINDTDYRAPADTALNTTNIIRLTNEIHNTINNRLGNVTARNENNIHVHNNVSTTGGKYGLGFNERGSCCLVLRQSRSCDAQSTFSTAARCHHKRQRVCGERCKARVMHAKRVNYCTDTNGDNCYQSIKYVPYRPKRASLPRCHYTQMWPFVACPRRRSTATALCQHCLRLTYGHILMYGMPAQCVACYQSAGMGGGAFYAPAADWSALAPPMYDEESVDEDWNVDGDEDENELTPDGAGWRIDKSKCRSPDGTIIENCHHQAVESNEMGSGDSMEPAIVGPRQHSNYDIADDDFTDVGEADSYRRRRRAFKRSSYSRRYKPIIVD